MLYTHYIVDISYKVKISMLKSIDLGRLGNKKNSSGIFSAPWEWEIEAISWVYWKWVGMGT